jgi:ABC-type transport system involved in cytochrome bd biosynthesis fused ATPase/permease subunit
MLAFTFQIATGRFDKRKELLLDETTNIRTTYLRAKLLPEPFNSQSRTLLKDYVDVRVDLANDPSSLSTALARSQEILDSLWGIAVDLSELDRSSEIYALYTQSVNDLYANFNHRVTMTFEYRVPPMVIWILVIIAVISMFILGLNFGLTGKKGFVVSLLLAFIFALVMFLIVALNHPETGLIKLNTKPVFTLQQQLKAM